MNAFDVELRNVVKRYGHVTAVNDISLGVESGSFLTLLGPSGCGKTTTLRMIGGFERPSSGEIFLLGKRMTNEPPFRRNTNMLFQDYALFPHKTVAQNIGFGLKMRGVRKAEIEKRVREMLDLIHLPDVYDRRPDQLSGGQRQRVALTRVLILKPRVLLLDEPLGALDAKIRKELQLELKQLQRELGITFVYVTHDQEEAMTMSDSIAIMNEGRSEQLGSPREIYEKPRTRFIAQFIGECNLIDGRVVGFHQGMIEIQDAHSRVFRVKGNVSESSDLKNARACVKGCINRLEGRLKEKLYTGFVVRLIIEVNNDIFTVDAKKDIVFSSLDNVKIGWHPEAGSIIIEQ